MPKMSTQLFSKPSTESFPDTSIFIFRTVPHLSYVKRFRPSVGNSFQIPSLHFPIFVGFVLPIIAELMNFSGGKHSSKESTLERKRAVFYALSLLMPELVFSTC